MLKRIITALLAVALFTTVCPMALAADSTDSSTETVWSDEYVPNGDFEGTKDYSAKSNASLVSTTDTGHGSKVVSVNKGGYFYFTQYYPTPDDNTAVNRRLTLINAAKAGGKLKFEFDVKPASGDTLTQLRIMLRTGSSGEFGAKYLVPAECTIDDVAQSTIFSAAKSSAGTTNLSLTGGQWYHFCLVYDFKGIDTDTSSALYAAETDGFWTFIGVNGNSNGGVTLFDNISVKTADPVATDEEETPEEELPPFRDIPNPASGVTLATEAEIATLGDLPEGIGTIYKKTVTIGSGGQTTCELLYYPNALTREGAYDLKVFLFEPTTNPATDGTGLHRMLRYSRFSTSHSWKGDIAYVMYDQNARMGVWNTYDGTVNIDKSNAADAYTTDRIGFRWVLGNDGWKGGADHPYPDIIGETATLYFSISLTSGVKPDKATAVIETTKWSGENLFDEAGYLASAGAVKETVGSETVISAGTNYTLVQSALDLSWDPSALYRISFKARGDGTSTYTSNGRVQFRTNSATEFTGTIPAADLATGNWNEYSMICDMSTLEQTFKDGNTMLCDRGTTTWWLMLRRGSSSEGPVYYKDIVFEKAVPTATGETPVYTSAIFTFENNSLETLSIPQGTLILAEYNSDGSFNRAITKSFVKNAQTFTLKKQNTADSETYEGQVGGIIPDSTGAVRLDIPGYDSTKTYQLMIWDSVAGMNSLFGVTASK